MIRLTIDHHFRPTERELSRVAALRYAHHRAARFPRTALLSRLRTWRAS